MRTTIPAVTAPCNSFFLLVCISASGITACQRPRSSVQPPLTSVPVSPSTQPPAQAPESPAPRPADLQAHLTEEDVAPSTQDDELVRQAMDDPLAFLKMCREHYLSTVRDYRCTFHIRERESSNGELGPHQEIDVRFREHPFSVDMRWNKNPVRAKRVNYVAGRWRHGERELAMIYPSGVVALLAPAGVKLDIHSPEVREASRRPVDDFGFRRTLELIIATCEKAQADPSYALSYIGERELYGRPSLVLRRLLPYTGPESPYPDRLLLIYIDREWLVPTGCYSFADDREKEPIGAYVTNSVRLNTGLTDADF